MLKIVKFQNPAGMSESDIEELSCLFGDIPDDMFGQLPEAALGSAASSGKFKNITKVSRDQVDLHLYIIELDDKSNTMVKKNSMFHTSPRGDEFG